MTTPAPTLLSSTRQPSPELTALLLRLKPGQRIRVTQTVRVGLRQWSTTVTGAFRGVNHLATGLATDRVVDDEIVVIAVHFSKEPHGELSSVTLDEQSKIELIEA
jgi:hypothetical protein